MILDPGNKYIQAINSHTPLSGATILEIGCGNGQMTAEMAKFANKIVATDMNTAVLEQAKKHISAVNVDFLHTPDGTPDLPARSFDIVIYTLSLHHIPEDKMVENLHHSGRRLKDNGKIVVIEPGNGGSFLEVKKRFGAGSGDESREKKAAMTAMENMDGWALSQTHHFEVDFQFTDETDFFTNKLPGYQDMPAEKIIKLKNFLTQNTTSQGIILTSERYLNLLTRKHSPEK
ncbi:MAG: class I SAM-dependent methyltransferase [Thermodesulfobacteriota bacterium]|nr:class I SAM-dependent methyltransferase [Thermodesulfobacteriota bacterium]